MKTSSAVYAFLALLLVTPALAQLPVPKAANNAAPQTPQQNTAAPVATVPDFDSTTDGSKKPLNAAQDYVDKNGIVRNPDGTVKLTAQAMKETQEIQEQERKREAAAGGFKWIAWNKAGQKVWDFIFERDPAFREKVALTKGEFFDIAVHDTDSDSQPDIIVWHWNDCGQMGCLYTVFFGNKAKTPETYIGRVVRPYKNGITVDGGYFGL